MDTGTESGSFLYDHQRNQRPIPPASSLRRKPVKGSVKSLLLSSQQRNTVRGQYQQVNNRGRQEFRGPSRSNSVTLPSISEVRSSHEYDPRHQTQHDDAENEVLTRFYDQPLTSEDVSTTLNNDSSNTSEGGAEVKRSAIYISSCDWKPWLLHHVGLFICYLVGHILIFGIGRYFTERNGIIVKSVSANYWFFRFAPSFLAVFIKEWCSRLTADYRSIDAFFPENMRHQERSRNFVRRFFASSKMYATSRYSVFDISGYIASLLIIIQSTILMEVLITRATGTSFTVVNSEAFSVAFEKTMIPALTVPSYFRNQSFTSAPWFTEISSDFGLLTTQIGALPFSQSSPSTNADSLTCLTTGYASSLNCVPILNPTIQMRSAGSSLWDVTVNLNDSRGCRSQGTFSGVPLTGSQNFTSGAVGNNTFAIWRYLEDSLNTAKSNASCSPTTQFILFGQVSQKTLPNTKTYVSVTALDDGWNALSCSSQYLSFNDNLKLTVNMDNSPSTTDATITDNAVVVNSTSSQSFDRTMKQNFLDTGIIATLGGWYTGKTFWNIAAQYSWSGTESIQNNGSLCISGSSLMSLYQNTGTCNMYVNIATLWPSLFSLSIPAVASYIPESSWIEAQGQVVEQDYGWVVSAGALYASAVLHALMIILLLTTRMLHLPRFVPQFLQRHIGHQISGLKRNPATIAAKVELFQEPRIRNLFTGIDALEQKEASAELRHRISPVKIRTCVQQTQSTTNPQQPPKESAFMKLDPTIILPPEYESIKELPRDEYELANLRFGYMPSTLRLASLLFTSSILCIIFAGGVYMTQNEQGYYFWRESFSEGHSWTLWGQEAVFNLLPIIVLLVLRWWWTKVDTFFRLSQPYVGLYHSLPGKYSVCLKYINDIDVVIMLRSIKNKHFHLIFITTMALLVKFALILAGGLFCFQSGLSKNVVDFQPLLSWRNNTFSASVLSFDEVTRRSVIFSSMFGTGGGNFHDWQMDGFAFSPIDIRQSGMFEMQIPGLSADLECQQITTDFSIVGGSLVAKLQNSDCEEATWRDFCHFTTVGSNGGSYTALAWSSKSSSSTSTSTSISSKASTTKSTTTSLSSRLSSNSTTTSLSSRLSANSTSTSRTTSRSTMSSNNTTSASITSTTATTTLKSMKVTATALIAIPAPSPTMPGTTNQCYVWYTPQPGDYCWEIAQQDDMDWEVLRVLNPNIDPDCHNLQPYKSYCVDGVSPTKLRPRTPRDTISKSGSCTGWRYLESNSCTSSANASGKWWIIDAHGFTVSPANSTWQGLSTASSSTSLLCTPRYWMYQVDVTVWNNPDQNIFNLTIGKVRSSTQLKENTWVQADNSSVSFSDYLSTGLQKYGFAGTFYEISDTKFLDVLSLVAASNSTGFTTAFQDATQFAKVASTAFGRAFVQVANRSISSDGSTSLLQPSRSSSQSVQAYEVLFNAVPSKVPLYGIMIILALCVLTMGFVYPNKTRRMASNPAVLANVISSVYDSSIISKVRKAVDEGRDPSEELKDVPFSYGVYYGESTRVRRLGIDTSENIAEHIHNPNQHLPLFRRLRQRLVPRSRGAQATEKDHLDQDSDFEIPYIAEYNPPQEMGTSPIRPNPFNIPQRRFTLSGFEPRQHAQAEETGYLPPQRAREYDQPETLPTQPNEVAKPMLSRTQTLKSRVGTVLSAARRAGQSDALLEEDDVVVQPLPSGEPEILEDRTRMNRDGEAGLFAAVKKYTKGSTVRVREVNRSGYRAPDTGVPRPRGYMDSVRDWTSKWRIF